MLVRVLGPLHIDGGRSIGIGQAGRLLGMLALHANTVVPTPELADVVLGTERAEVAPDDLYVVVSRVRSFFRTSGGGQESPAIRRRGGGYELVIERADLDAAMFEALVDRARSGVDPTSRRNLYEQALGLWRGGVLENLDLPVTAAAVRMGELATSALEELLRVRLEVEAPAVVLPELLGLCERHPTREGLISLAVECLWRCGRRDDALSRLQRLRRDLAVELGIEPSMALRLLEQRLLDDERAPMAAASSRSTAVPAPPLGAFYGRARELDTVGRFLATCDADRLLTVAGPGGVGKTRLSLEALSTGTGSRRGFADLTALGRLGTTADTVAAAVGHALGESCASVEELCALLGEGEVALVLDNCEHLAAETAIVTRRLLGSCPGVRILATSRQPLGVSGERVLRLGALPRPEAVRLLAERAERASGDHEFDANLLDRVCAAVDGLPLALELAASRLRTMGLAELVARLGDQLSLLRVPQSAERHASLGAVIDWSVSLLEPAAVRLFERLGVFTGGFDLPALVAICDLEGDEWAIIDALHHLVGASLVNADRLTSGTTRYRMLDAVRAAAVGRLVTTPDERIVRRRHADHYAALAGRPYELGTDLALETELPNLRSAVQHTLDAGDAHLALTLTGRLGGFAMRQIGGLEAEGWAHRALALGAAGNLPDARWTHHAIAIIRNVHADAVGCERHARRAIEIGERHDLAPDARFLNTAVIGVVWQGRLEEARRLAEQALAIATEANRLFEQVDALFNLIHCEKYEGRQPSPLLVSRAFDIATAAGADVGLSIVEYAAAIAAYGVDNRQAAEHFRACLDRARSAGARHLLLGPSRTFLGLIDADGDPLLALTAVQHGLNFFAELGVAFGARRLPRAVFPDLIALGQHEAVAVLDAATAPISYLPDQSLQAVTTARAALGEDRFDLLHSQGAQLTDARLNAYLAALITEPLGKAGRRATGKESP